MTLEIPRKKLDAPHDSSAVEGKNERSTNNASELGSRFEAVEIERKLSLSPTATTRALLAMRAVRAISSGVVALNLSFGEVAAQTKPESAPILSEQQRQTVEKVTGRKFNELSSQFMVEMPIDMGPNGKYIIHFAQTHRHPDTQDLTFMYQRAFQDQVVRSQRLIEPLLLSTVQADNAPCVFEEGITPTTDLKYLNEQRDTIRIALTQLRDLESSKLDSYESLFSAVENFKKLDEKTTNIFLHHYLGQGLERMRQKFFEAIPAIRGQEEVSRAQELASGIDGRTVEFKRITRGSDLTLLQERMDPQGFRRKTFSKLMEEPDPYALGVTWKLFVEGSISEICPAEDSSLNDRAMAAIKKFDEAKETLRQKVHELHNAEVVANPTYATVVNRLNSLLEKGRKNWSEHETTEVETLSMNIAAKVKEFEARPEAIALDEALKSVSKEARRLVLDERNTEVLKKINEREQRGTFGNIPVMFGANHQFQEQLLRWNRGTNNVRGLIKITPVITRP